MKRRREEEVNKTNLSGSSSGSDTSSSESSEEAPALALDQHGRIAGAYGEINYNFQCYNSIFQSESQWSKTSISALIEDCKVSFTAREVNESADYSDGETFFVPANSLPTTNIERLVLDIFRCHTENMTYDPKRSGAEWWSLVVDAEDGGVGFHWDKDYGMEEHGVSIFPHLATVTYLGEVEAAPTLILQKVAPPMYHEDVSGPCGDKALLSWPEHGKHIVFDGRFLHAAVPEMIHLKNGASKEASNTNKKRVSLLVNIWLNHLPRDAHPIAQSFKQKLSCEGLSLETSSTSRKPLVNLALATDMSKYAMKVDPGKKNKIMRWDFTHSSEKYSITVPVPVIGASGGSGGSQDTGPSEVVLGKKLRQATTLQFEFDAPSVRPNVSKI
jgi:hypothetical protein